MQLRTNFTAILQIPLPVAYAVKGGPCFYVIKKKKKKKAAQLEALYAKMKTDR